MMMNFDKTVVMTCQRCHISVRQSKAAYTLRMIGYGLYYKSIYRERVRFLDCGAELASRYMVVHRQNQHGQGRDPQ